MRRRFATIFNELNDLVHKSILHLRGRPKRANSCSEKVNKHMQICKTYANLCMHISLLWQKLAVFARTRGEICTRAPNYSICWILGANGMRKQKFAKRRRTLGELAYANCSRVTLKPRLYVTLHAIQTTDNEMIMRFIISLFIVWIALVNFHRSTRTNE